GLDRGAAIARIIAGRVGGVDARPPRPRPLAGESGVVRIVRSNPYYAAGPALFLGVLELGRRLPGLPGRSGQDDLAHLLLEFGHRYGDVVLADPKESADADDRVGQRSLGGDDQVVDFADLLPGRVVDILPEDLLLRAPADRDFAHLRGGDHGRAR